MSAGAYDFDPYGFHLFRRCVQCPEEPPQCPDCRSDETCSLLAQSCAACASTSCVKMGSLPGQLAQKSTTPVGTIVGGVMGAVVCLAILTYFGYRYWFRKQKQDQKVALWDPPEKRDPSTLHRSARQSTAAHSIASTVQTRASNVIQIAFIPGVTTSPDMGAPPVPAVPGGVGHNSATATTPEFEQHFFMPGDLRDSTWSDTSSIDPRISLTPSLARQSVATTIWRNDAIVPPIPAQQAFRAQANVVSVKNSSSVPATPLPGSTGNNASQLKSSSIVAKHVVARPIEIRKGGAVPRMPTASNLSRLNGKKSNLSVVSDANNMPFYSDEKEVVITPPSGTTELTTLPAVRSQPSLVTLNDSKYTPSLNSSPRLEQGSLDAMIADALNKAAKEPHHTGLGARPSRPGPHNRKDSGPFSDSNEIQ